MPCTRFAATCSACAVADTSCIDPELSSRRRGDLLRGGRVSLRGSAHALHRGVHVANELTARRHHFTDLRRCVVDRHDRALDAIERR